MTEAALRKAERLLADPPENPDTSNGYLDLLGEQRDRNAGAVQALWASRLGSLLYDNAQTVARRLMTAWQEPTEWLNIPVGGTALDVGSGPTFGPAGRPTHGWPVRRIAF